MSPRLTLSLFTFCCVHTSASWARPKQHNRTVDVEQLKDMFSDMLQRAAAGDEDFSVIKAAMHTTFNTLPKNEFQRLSHSAVAYLVHDYFARNYQWHFRGLGAERNGVQAIVSSLPWLRDTTIPQEMAPQYVEEVLQSQASGKGLTLSDAAAMAATLQELVLEDNEVILMKAYEVLGLPLEKPLRTDQLPELLLTFAFTHNGKQSVQALKQRLRFKKPSHFMSDFAQHTMNLLGVEAYQRRHRINPFKPRRLGFDEVLDAIENGLLSFGKWQESTCVEMKNYMIKADPSGSGRIPLGVFYAQPDMRSFRFHESEEYLRETGSLDDSVNDLPQVLISNYVLGPANCFTSTTYFQFCCVNNCMTLLGEIEKDVVGSEAKPEDLIPIVKNASARVSIDLAEQADELPDELLKKLHSVAKIHGGKVPLHARLFAQWLHFGFPTECPYPHVPKQGNAAVTADHLMTEADPSEMQRYIEAAGGADHVSKRTLSQWTDDEILYDVDPATLSTSMRAAVRALAVLLALSATVVTLSRASRRTVPCDDLQNGDKGV